MLTAIVSGDQAIILKGLMMNASELLKELKQPPILVPEQSIHQMLDILHGRRISHEITLSREN